MGGYTLESLQKKIKSSKYYDYDNSADNQKAVAQIEANQKKKAAAKVNTATDNAVRNAAAQSFRTGTSATPIFARNAGDLTEDDIDTVLAAASSRSNTAGVQNYLSDRLKSRGVTLTAADLATPTARDTASLNGARNRGSFSGSGFGGSTQAETNAMLSSAASRNNTAGVQNYLTDTQKNRITLPSSAGKADLSSFTTASAPTKTVAQTQAQQPAGTSASKLETAAKYVTYPAAQFGAGMTSVYQNASSGLQTALGDLSTGGDYSNGYKILEDYFTQHPTALQNVTGADGYNYTKIVAGNAGVSEDVLKAYLKSTEAERTQSEINNDSIGSGLNSTYKNIVGNGAYMAGQMVPGIAMTAGGSASPEAGVIARTVTAAQNAKNGEKLAAVGKALLGENAKAIVGNPATWSIAANVGGQQLTQNARQYGYQQENYTNAAAYAFLESYTEGLFGFSDMDSVKAALSGVTGNSVKSVGKAIAQYMVNGAEEGLEEVVVDPMEAVADKLTTQPGKPLVGTGGIFDVKQMAQDGLAGAAMGLVMGGVGSVSSIIYAAEQSGNIKRAAQQLNQVSQILPEDLRPAELDPNTATQEDVNTQAAAVLDGVKQYETQQTEQDTQNASSENTPLTAQEALEAVNPETVKMDAERAQTTQGAASETEVTTSAQKQAPGAQETVTRQNVPGALPTTEKLSQSLGAEGKKAYLSMAAGKSSAAEAYRAFSAWYAAGLTGREQAGTALYGDDLTEQEHTAAFLAGTRDAAASLAKEKADDVQSSGTAGFSENEYSGSLSREDRALLGSLSRFLGVSTSMTAPTGENGYNGFQHGASIGIASDAEDPVSVVLRHEATHRIQALAPEAYRVYRDFAVNTLAELSGVDTSDYIQAKIGEYANGGVNLTQEGAMDEIAADFAGRFDEERVRASVKKFAGEHRNVVEKIRDALRELVARLRRFFAGKRDKSALRSVEKAYQLWTDALNDAGKTSAKTAQKSSAQEGGGVKYSIDKYFERQIDKWDGLDHGGAFKVGRPSEALLLVGIPDADIWMDQSKAAKQLNTKVEVTKEILKGIPALLEHPIVVSESYDNTVMIFGQMYDRDGNPIVVALRVNSTNRRNHITMVNKIRSVGTRTHNLDKLLSDETILYLGENKRETNTWFNALGRSTPFGGTKYGLIRSISTSGEKSNPKISMKAPSGETEKAAKALAALREENVLLRERVDYWKGQTKRTARVSTDKKAVLKEVKRLMHAYDSDLGDPEELAGKLSALYDYIANGGDGKDELTWESAREKAVSIAREIVESASREGDELYREYEQLRKYLRETPLTLSESDRSNFPDWGDFRKRNMGRLNLKGGNVTNVDSVYQELSQMWPEFFDETRESHPADQLERIASVMADIYDVTATNPFSSYMDEAVDSAANEILETFFDLPQTRATFADKQARKLQEAKAAGTRKLVTLREQKNARMGELRAENRKRVREAIRRERADRDEKLSKLKTRYAEKTVEGREARNARELRAKIIRHAKNLSGKLLRPSDKQHIPESLQKAAADVLASINLESAWSVEQETGRRVKNTVGTPTKRTEAFRELRLAYEAISREGGNGEIVLDPDLMENISDIERMKDTPIAEMGTEQLTTVWKTLRAMEASIRTAGKMLGQSRFETVYQAAKGLYYDNAWKHDRGNVGQIDRFVNLDMMTPQEFFHRLGKAGEDLFTMLRGGQDRYIKTLSRFVDDSRDIFKGHNIRAMRRGVLTFDVDGRTLTMNRAQVMSLYELLKRKQAIDHIFIGGIKPKDTKIPFNVVEHGQSEPFHITLEDAAEITAALTDEERDIADKIGNYMSTKVSDAGNEASMEVYGYKKFNEKHYFPLDVDKNQVSTEISKEAQATTISGRGYTKSTVPHAGNAVNIRDIFSVYADHLNDMATYSAWLSVMENMQRIRNFVYRDDTGNTMATVKSIVERVFGKYGNGYLNDLITDLNQGVRLKNGPWDAMISNYKASAVAMNLRVIVQQPTSILRAMAYIDPADLAAGSVRRGDWDEVMKYAPIARWKDWGNFDINTGRQVEDIILGSDSTLSRAKEGGMWAAGRADSFAWSRLWNAVKREIRRTQPSLRPGSEEFYQATAERFGYIVDRTQVVDGILQRNPHLRSRNALDRMSSSFMSEPMKVYNMFTGAVYDMRNARGAEARKAAKRHLLRVTFALLASFAANAVMQSLMDALRDDDREKDYWQKFMETFDGFTGDEASFLDFWNSFWDGNLESNVNALSYYPYFKDIVSIIQGYDVTRMDMEAAANTAAASKNLYKALTGDGSYTVKGAMANLIAEASRMVGLPVSNVKRDAQAILMTVAEGTDNYLLQYRINAFWQTPTNSSLYMDILYDASLSDPEAYQIIYDDMIKNGVTEAQIREQMENRMKADQGVENVADLETRYLTPEQTTVYSSKMSTIQASAVWASASDDQKKYLQDDLYNLTVGTLSGEKLQEKIDAGADVGLDDTEFMEYWLALQEANASNEDESKRNKSYSQDEAEAAINMLTGLSREEEAYLWQSTNTGWNEKNNPYK